jgi:PAS domain S-box-containing protein
VNALRDSEALFRAVAENLNAGLIVTDVENRAVYVNRYMCARTGYAVEELLGRQMAPLLFSPDEQVSHAQRLQRRLAGVRETYDVVHRCKDGSTFLGEVSASPLHDGEGRVIGTIGVMIDVTERHAWEREIAEREQRYRLLFEAMPLPAWVYDVETLRFLAVNPAAVQRYGYGEEEFLTMTILDIRPPEDVERVRAQVRARREGHEGQSHGQPYRHRRADGTVFDVEIASYAFEFEGRAARIVVVNDVTERARIHRRERELEAQLLLAQKMEAVGRLAGGVAHDFNNLLSVVLNAAGAIGEALPPASPLREEVADIRQAAERGAALTRQLLAFGRKEVHAPGPLDVHAVVANVERLLARALGAGVRLEVRRGSGDLRTVADASQLEQVLVNLAINARDAMPDGGRVTVTTALETLAPDDAATLCVAAGAYVTIEVADDGVGMDEVTRARAFEPFYTTKGPQQGSGLGLSTVYGIVRQSAGAVTLASAAGAGTRVKVYLPSSPSGTAARAGAPSPDTPPEHGARSSAGTVLLVEDEPRVRAQTRRLLERCGYAVIEAADGAEGALRFDERRSDVDVVVSDIVMPRLGGVEMVARLRTTVPDVPVVFVSGYAAEDRALPLDARTAFVPKPYTIATLCAAIAAVVAG